MSVRFAERVDRKTRSPCPEAHRTVVSSYADGTMPKSTDDARITSDRSNGASLPFYRRVVAASNQEPHKCRRSPLARNANDPHSNAQTIRVPGNQGSFSRSFRQFQKRKPSNDALKPTRPRTWPGRSAASDMPAYTGVTAAAVRSGRVCVCRGGCRAAVRPARRTGPRGLAAALGGRRWAVVNTKSPRFIASQRPRSHYVPNHRCYQR